MGLRIEKAANVNRMNEKTRQNYYVKDMKKPTAAQTKQWEARLTRMGCSIHAGIHKWLGYEYENTSLFLAALAEYDYPAKRHRTGAKRHAE